MMSNAPGPLGPPTTWFAARVLSEPNALVAISIFVFTFLVFWCSPVTQVTDSNYSMLLSQDLIEHRSFVLDHYAIPRLTPEFHYNTIMNGEIHQLELRDGHLYYYFPPGTSVLSVPFVALMKAGGISAANADGTHNLDAEISMQSMLAAFLMAVLAVVFFYTARLVLPLSWSAVIALGSAFGTQMWSTASRALWTDTWGILLLGIVVWMLFRSEVLGRRLNSMLLGTLLAWTYFVRPTNAVPILAISVYVFLYRRRLFLRYLVTGLAWLALFVAYSWYHFHQLLPQYYLANRLAFKEAWLALPGNLISPSRGLLVFVPVLFFIAFLLWRYRRQIKERRLLFLSLAVIVLHLIVIAGFIPWHAGFSYGPRFSTGLLPWLTLTSIIAIKAMLDWQRQYATGSTFAWRAQLACGGLLLLLSILINARGAVAHETWIWNIRPTNVDDSPGKVWDWRQPQFLAGFVHPPFPGVVPLVREQIDFTKPESPPFLWYGWSEADPQSRWTDGHEAALVFAMQNPRDTVLTVKTGGFVGSGHSKQRVTVSLNATVVGHFEITDDSAHEYTIELPANQLRAKNVLTFTLPDAAAPESLGLSRDFRKLGLAVYWLKFTAK